MRVEREEMAGAAASERETRQGSAGRMNFYDAIAALVALVGVFDAMYLTVEHLSGRSVRCIVTSGCDEVLQSSYATIAGNIPLASLGALAYFTIFSLATLAAFGYAGARKFVAPLVALMFAATLWLFYLQAFVLHAFCAYCLLSAAVTTSLVIIVATQHLLISKRKLS